MKENQNGSPEGGGIDTLLRQNFNRRDLLKGLVTTGVLTQIGGLGPLGGRGAQAAGDPSADYVVEPSRKIPVYSNVDVLVVGGGMAGVSAAVTAGRLGMKTMLVEYQGFLGGNATNALVNDFCGFYTRTRQAQQIVKGVGGEIVQALIDQSGGRKWRHVVDFNPEILKIILDKMLMEAKVAPLYYTAFASPIMDGNTIRGIFVENKAGRQAILARSC